MKNHIKFLSILVLAAQFALPATSFAKRVQYPISILPDEPSSGYEMLNEQFQQQGLGVQVESSYVEMMIKAGTQNMSWLKYMNEDRPDKIALTKPGELTAYPIETPSVYSPATIEKSYKDLIAQVPENMRKIIFEGAEFTKEPGLALEDYIKWAKKVDRAYQTASRWKLISPSLYWYTQNAVNDVRGYYYLGKEENLQQKLTGWAQLSNDDQTRLGNWLVQVCTNVVQNKSACQQNLMSATAQNKVAEYYAQYNPGSKELWDGYFNLEASRQDFVWTHANENLLTVPFHSTEAKVQDYLKTNIEDEWKWNDWQLRLNFTDDADIHVIFVPGATPHVDGINGNTITMDDNAPLTEWDVQWTIRHEFGHVVGFPDCYVEFYDEDAQQMVNYQLDITNLMCSRKGKFKQVHYDEMRKKYLN
jgi:hypothetical protein